MKLSLAFKPAGLQEFEVGVRRVLLRHGRGRAQPEDYEDEREALRKMDVQHEVNDFTSRCYSPSIVEDTWR